MNEDLINQIVRRILSDPALQTLLNPNLAGHGETQVEKQNALILLNYVSDFGRVLTAVKNRYGTDYTLTVLPSDQVYRVNLELPEGMTWISVDEALTKRDWQTMIVPACSPNLLAKIALGIRDNPMSELIGQGICQGKTVELVTEYLGLTKQTPQAYRDLYKVYLEKAQTYGILVRDTLEDSYGYVSEANQSNAEAMPTTISPIGQTQTPLRFTKKFLGDKQAYGFPEGTTVLVNQETVISPLARDTLKQRRIELCVEKEETRR